VGERFTLAGEARADVEIRKSRFLARAAPAGSVGDALAFLARARETDASHNGWAYRVGPEYRFNDDGEPGGTAGKPILQAIDGQRLDRVAVVVARWFGGVKLGAGGLVRAYGGTAAECLRLAEKRVLVARVALRVSIDFSSAGVVRSRLAEFDAAKREEIASDDGVVMVVDVAVDGREAFERFVADVTRGRGCVVRA
jgi:putative IMPACT (imprinted ancient) family translation regulator